MSYWSKLSMKDKADVMKLFLDKGISDLDTIRREYNTFAEGGDKWTMQDESNYRAWRASLPSNLRNTDDNDYDMRGAFKAGMIPTLESDGYYHLGSRDPRTGRILKAPHHPTYLQAINTDSRMGYYPQVDKKGNTYTSTWKGNMFAGGGDTNDNDLVDWIIREEGFNSKPENIGDGKITLGSGLTDPKWHALYKKRGNKWSAEDNRMAVAEEVANRRKWAEKNIPNWNTLPDSAQKALLSYKYNYNFTSANSPKLFQALADSNLYEAAKQMDATSKDPKFKKGLMDRRKREQEWFLSDVTGNAAPTQTIPVQAPVTINTSMIPLTEPAVSTAVRNNYVPATTTPYNRGNNMRRGFESAVAYNRMMDATSLQNNPLPEYPFPIGYADGGKIHIDPSKKGTFTAAASRHGMGVQEFASRVLANKEDYSPAMVKKANFARNASKWHGLGGNLFEIGGDKNSYDAPQTFAGRVAHVAGASPRAVREADIVSSVLQMTPYGYTAAALDLGRDMNRVYHGEEGAWKDAGLDILGMIPGVSKLGMKKIKPKTWIGKMKQGYDELLQPAREGVNSAINVLKALDFTDDTWGANKTSDAKQAKRKKY